MKPRYFSAPTALAAGCLLLQGSLSGCTPSVREATPSAPASAPATDEPGCLAPTATLLTREEQPEQLLFVQHEVFGDNASVENYRMAPFQPTLAWTGPSAQISQDELVNTLNAGAEDLTVSLEPFGKDGVQVDFPEAEAGDEFLAYAAAQPVALLYEFSCAGDASPRRLRVTTVTEEGTVILDCRVPANRKEAALAASVRAEYC